MGVGRPPGPAVTLDVVAQALDAVHALVLTLALVSARLLGVMAIAPAFERLGWTNTMRGAAAMAFAAPMVTVTAPPMFDGGLPTMFTGVGLVLKEVTVGFIIGFIFGIPFWAAQAAGDIMDLQRGSTSATLVDPGSGTDGGVTGTLLTLAMLAMFFSANGVDVLVAAVYDSYRLWPLDRLWPQFELAHAFIVLRLLNDITFLGVLMAAPIMAAMLITDVVLAFVARAAPQLNAFSLSMALKNLVFMLLLVVYCAFLVAYMRDGLAYGVNSARVLGELAPRQ